METNEILNKLYAECNLNKKEDIFTKKFKDKMGNITQMTIIKKSGIEKIISHKKIKITYDIICSKSDFASVKAKGEYNGIYAETTGSAFSKNSTNNYYLEMAEKRAMARIVIKLTNLCFYNIIGEDELVDNPSNVTKPSTKEIKELGKQLDKLAKKKAGQKKGEKSQVG